MNNSIKNFFGALAILLSLSATSFAQPVNESPYSRFGIGDIYQHQNAFNMSLGGLKYSIQSPLVINPANPASYTAFNFNHFVFDASMSGDVTRLQTTDKAKDNTYLNFSGLTFGMPVSKNWSTAFGVLPYSNVGYEITENLENPDFGGYQNVYTGRGGLTKTFIGTAVNIDTNWSIGINANYLFGSLDNIQTLVFDSAHFLNVQSTKSRIIRDFTFDIGIQYTAPINKERRTFFTAGVSATSGRPNGMNAWDNILTQTFAYNSSNVLLIRDTIQNIQGDKGKIILPYNIGGGFSFYRDQDWMFGIEGSYQNWSSYEYFGLKDSLSNSLQLNAGGQYKLGKVLLRGGFRYHQTFLQLEGSQLNEFGISFGLALPVFNKNYSNSLLNLGFEVGQRGTTDNDLIQENFARVMLSITMNQERWFLRRKYN